MKRFRLILLAAFMAGLFITNGFVRNEEFDSVKQLRKAQVALQARAQAEHMMAEAEATYQMAMATYEGALTEGEHRRGMKYLFIDRKHVQRLDGVEQVFHQPVKDRGPVVVPDHPWELGLVVLWSAPVWSEERSRWQMWYYGGEEALPLYAESSDGLRWVKPSLGLVDWKGSLENNIINLGFKTRNLKENRFVLVRDERATDPARRFKGLTRMSSGNLRMLVSADGLDWKPLEGDSMKPLEGDTIIPRVIRSDDEYRLNYDALHHRFMATVKMSGENGGHTAGERPLLEFGRRVALAVSEDFVHWSEPRLILWGDEVDQQIGKKRIEEAIEDTDRRRPLFVRSDQFYTDIYNMPLFTYEDMYLGLPVIFNQSGVYSHTKGSNQDGILYPSLVVTRDLQLWDRLSRQPFIPLSGLSDANNYDNGMIYSTPPVYHGEELWFYYTGTRFTHLKPELIEQAGLRKSPDEPMKAIFLARLRMDGFASLHAGRQQGAVLTVMVKVTGPRLYVNVDAREGELYTEIRDAGTGKALQGYMIGDDPARNDAVPVCEDVTRVPIRWQEKTDVSELLGREVRLYFSLRNAHLYSFWFDD